MIRKNVFLLAAVFTCIISACNKPKVDQLKSVIEHYSKDPKDSLKLKAAKFLIENLKGLATLDTTSVESNQVYFDLIYNTWKHEKMRVGFRLPIQTRVIDSLNAADKLPQTFPSVRYVDDADLVTADFLIDNIDNAFYVWQNMPWAKGISFKDFCEYILPYRCSSTYSLDARQFFLDKYKNLKDSVKNSENPFVASQFINNDISKWFAEDLNLIGRYPYLQPIKFSNLLKGKFGDCQDAQSVRITALRAMGIPAVMDEIAGWGNSDLTHYWYKVVDPVHDTIKTRITNKNIKTSTSYIIPTSTFDEVDYHEYPANIELKYIRSVPKVYRRCFGIQANSLAIIKGPNVEVPKYFLNPRIKDVSKEYLETADVSIRLSNKNHKYAYLCTFDNQNWRPVAWASNSNTTRFKDMGKNIVYLPAYYSKGAIISAGSPFLLDSAGKVKLIKAAHRTETVKLYAKFPSRTYVLANEHTMVGGRFQLANKSDLSDTVTVNTVKTTPFYKTEFRVNDNKKYRYLIYQFKNIPIMHMSELTFYGLDATAKEVELHGKLIGSKGSYPYKTERLYDGNRANYFKSARDDKFTYIGIDLGENNATKITRIAFVPHGDDNNIASNDKYRLYYWNDAWEPIAIETANKDNTVTFKNVPKNALLLIKDIAGGIEERIFRYKNGRQEFW